MAFAVVVNRHQYIRKRKIRKNGYHSTTPVVSCPTRKQKNLDDCVRCRHFQGFAYIDEDLYVRCLVDIRE